MSSRRHVLPINELRKYGAAPIFSLSEGINATDKRDQMQPEAEVVGVSLDRFHVVTSRISPIANESQMADLTSLLQARAGNVKKLHPPEIVFVDAFLSISMKGAVEDDSEGEGQEKVFRGDTVPFELRMDSCSALYEWAEAHCHLDEDYGNVEINGNERTSYRGVSVIKTADARLWDQKREKQQIMGGKHAGVTLSKNNGAVKVVDPEHFIGTRREFYFDWTYSTPYSGTATSNIRGEVQACPSSVSWIGCDSSGIEISLLMDNSVPILFYDDVRLYEDDLHDNGEVQLSVKVRVMPACFYVLMRMFLRVDSVLVRTRDTRIFHRFGCDRLFRDVSWREARWDELLKVGLPTDASHWTGERSQALINRLPLVDLPEDIPQHSWIDLKNFR